MLATCCTAARPRHTFSYPNRPGAGMNNPQAEQQFDSLVAQLHDWTESAVALDAGHFPAEMLRDLEDLIDELKGVLEDSDDYQQDDITELFVTPEMAEVIGRFPRVRRMIDRAWGAKLTGMIEEEGAGFGGFDEEDEEEDDDDDA